MASDSLLFCGVACVELLSYHPQPNRPEHHSQQAAHWHLQGTAAVLQRHSSHAGQLAQVQHQSTLKGKTADNAELERVIHIVELSVANLCIVRFRDRSVQCIYRVACIGWCRYLR